MELVYQSLGRNKASSWSMCHTFDVLNQPLAGSDSTCFNVPHRPPSLQRSQPCVWTWEICRHGRMAPKRGGNSWTNIIGPQMWPDRSWIGRTSRKDGSSCATMLTLEVLLVHYCRDALSWFHQDEFTYFGSDTFTFYNTSAKHCKAFVHRPMDPHEYKLTL